MGIAIILFCYSVLLILLAGAIGMKYPRMPFWQFVDIGYYPLGMLGVFLFFVSNGDARDRANDFMDYHNEIGRRLLPYDIQLDKELWQLNRRIVTILDLENECVYAPSTTQNNTFRDRYCKEPIKYILIPEPLNGTVITLFNISGLSP
jgi:hypothetical protein